MSRFVVDASVAIKWFIPEIHQHSALRLLDDRYELLAPDLIAPEFGNILWKKIRRQEITHREARAALGLFTEVNFEIQDSRPILPLALEIALSTGSTAYDSLYLAVAILQDCPIVTADRKFYNVLSGGPLRDHLFWVEDYI